VALAGSVVPANAFVALSVLSANYDDRHFTDPERFDIDRGSSRHLAFGHGIHFCLGAPLAWLETEITVNLLLDEFQDLRVTDKVVFHESEFRVADSPRCLISALTSAAMARLSCAGRSAPRCGAPTVRSLKLSLRSSRGRWWVGTHDFRRTPSTYPAPARN
jgi:Cytochrome P450